MSILDELKGEETSSQKQTQRLNSASRAKIMEIRNGVTYTWIAGVFDIGETQIRKRLTGVKPLRYEGEVPYFSLKDVAPMLGKIPEDKIYEIIENSKPSELPPKFQKAYWDAQYQKQSHMHRAGMLWNTDRVKDTLLDVFSIIRSSSTLWLTELERKTEVNAEQQKILQDSVASLLEKISQELEVYADQNEVYSEKFDEEGEFYG